MTSNPGEDSNSGNDSDDSEHCRVEVALLLLIFQIHLGEHLREQRTRPTADLNVLRGGGHVRRSVMSIKMTPGTLEPRFLTRL